MARELGPFGWARALGIGIADQGFLALAHLLVHIATARLIGAAQYGAFAIAFAVLTLLTGVHTALVAEPMSVIGPARYAGVLPRYFRTMVRLHARTVVLMLLPLLGVSAVLLAMHSSSAWTAVAVVAAAPPVLTFMLLRRVCYIAFSTPLAAGSSALYGITVGIGFAVLWRLGLISPASLMLLLGGCAGVACVPLLRGLPRPGQDGRSDFRTIWREHWEYGRWILAGTIANWGGGGIYLMIVGMVLTLPDAGLFRAVQNLIAPPQQVLIAIGVPILPWLSARVGTRGSPTIDRVEVVRVWVPATVLTLTYCAILLIAARPVTDFLYGANRYIGAVGLLPLFATFLICTAIAHGLTLSLRARGRTAPVFWSRLGFLLVALSIGVVLTVERGVTGASLGLALSAAAEAGILTVAVARIRAE